MGNYCCEFNRNSVDDGNLGGKIQYHNQTDREDKLKMNNKDNTNSNLSEINEIQQIYGENYPKDLDSKIPNNPPKVPHDRIPDSIINTKKKLKLTIKQSKYLSEGREFIINPGGLVGIQRNDKDGITLFGDISVNYKL